MINQYKTSQDNIAKATMAASKSIIEKIDSYLSTFNKSDIFSFSSEKSRIEEYTEKYFIFLSGIDKEIRLLTDLNAKCASLLIAADAAMEADVVIVAEQRLYAFDNFEHDLYNYTATTENALLESTATAAFLINKAQKFKLDVKKLIDANL
jgi:hypothetical protein